MKKLKIDLLYGSEALTLPAAALDKLPQADEAELKVLLSLCDPAVRAVFDSEAVAERLGITTDEVMGAVQFWRGAGILKKSELKQTAVELPAAAPAKVALPASAQTTAPAPVTEAAPEQPRTSVTIVRSDDGMPHYTAEEIDRIFSENGELSGMINECQNIFGKLFNPTEINKIMALTEYFRLDCEYVLLLCYYCKKIGKASVPFMDKLARSLYNEGIDTVDALGDRLGEMEAAADLGGFYRKLIGAGTRAFTEKEKRFLDQWVKWKIPTDMLQVAYEVCVDSAKSPSMPYINKVLSNWKEAGYTTVEQVKSAMEQYKQKKEAGTAASSAGSTFDTDEFFEAALRRTLAMHENS